MALFIKLHQVGKDDECKINMDLISYMCTTGGGKYTALCEVGEGAEFRVTETRKQIEELMEMEIGKQESIRSYHLQEVAERVLRIVGKL